MTHFEGNFNLHIYISACSGKIEVDVYIFETLACYLSLKICINNAILDWNNACFCLCRIEKENNYFNYWFLINSFADYSDKSKEIWACNIEINKERGRQKRFDWCPLSLPGSHPFEVYSTRCSNEERFFRCTVTLAKCQLGVLKSVLFLLDNKYLVKCNIYFIKCDACPCLIRTS